MSGILSLRRIWVDRPASDRTLQVASAIPTLGGTSISLPGTSLSLTSASVSPPRQAEPTARRGSSASTSGKIQEHSAGLVGRDSLFATWNLRRSSDWPSVKQTVKDVTIRYNASGQPKWVFSISFTGKPLSDIYSSWLSEAELSTTSRTQPLHARSIYLHHQFCFYAFGEDYHALVRSYRFDPPVSKLEVRKAVQISAYTTGDGESFGSALPMDIRQPSSFDEPLASAMSIQLGEFAGPSPKVLPMLPNGVPNPRLRDSIPIRSVAAGITDGVSEGLGRLRREINKAKSPRLKPMQSLRSGVTTSPSWAPIEFDEEDEDFLLPSEDLVQEPGPAAEGDATSQSTSRDGASILTPLSTQPDFFDSLDNDYGGHENFEDERGWSQEDRQAVEDAERFQDISAAGLMDEEQSASGLPELGEGARNKKRRGKK